MDNRDDRSRTLVLIAAIICGLGVLLCWRVFPCGDHGALDHPAPTENKRTLMEIRAAIERYDDRHGVLPWIRPGETGLGAIETLLPQDVRRRASNVRYVFDRPNASLASLAPDTVLAILDCGYGELRLTADGAIGFHAYAAPSSSQSQTGGVQKLSPRPRVVP